MTRCQVAARASPRFCATRALRQGPFLTSEMAMCPAASSASTQVRASAWKARRQAGLQNVCGWPPVVRGVNARPHQKQRKPPSMLLWARSTNSTASDGPPANSARHASA